MILNALALRLKRQARDDFKGRHYEATLILQAISWYLRYPLSYRDIEELFLERVFAVDHSTLNRWVLANAPLSLQVSCFSSSTPLPKAPRNALRAFRLLSM